MLGCHKVEGVVSKLCVWGFSLSREIGVGSLFVEKSISGVRLGQCSAYLGSVCTEARPERKLGNLWNGLRHTALVQVDWFWSMERWYTGVLKTPPTALVMFTPSTSWILRTRSGAPRTGECTVKGTWHQTQFVPGMARGRGKGKGKFIHRDSWVFIRMAEREKCIHTGMQ